ncbi:hypothetical protein KR093_001342 [Drosophila rubida]|uniref:Uncharacterized protein n=1 Tax=Drosophila rubida TaxID=30044 RepID=A0AAD4PK75_9MUSC|nr:hypothetical protein KR093_001342 [Drosophila rubida]
MEATQPKVHRQHQRQRRTEARQRRLEREAAAAASTPPDHDGQDLSMAVTETLESCAAALNDTASTTTSTTVGRISAQSSADSIEMVGSPSQTSQQTVVLVNGHAPPTQDTLEESASLGADEPAVEAVDHQANQENSTHLESPTQPTKQSDGSRNSSGDAMSLRETLRQLPATHGHRSRRTHSPQSPALRSLEVDSSFHRGILGYIDRELKQSSPTPSALSMGAGSSAGGGASVGGGASRKQQSLSDPQASPAQRSLRSRNSFDKSPRRKRSKSESRRRRERKLIAAGEMEVRQANETLMRYLKQCSDMHDASLSGELEIDQSLEERRVHRKTKSQRDKRGQLIGKLYSAGGLSSILKELADDIAPADGDEIYNPFTPVVSPTDDTPAHIDKMFLQTSSGYRPVEQSYYKRSFVGAARGAAAGGSSGSGCIGAIDGISAAELGGAGRLFRSHGAGGGNSVSGRGSYGDTRCLLDAELNRNGISSNIQLACVIQRIWLLISNICHGLLAGLALAHLLFVLSSHPTDWAKVINSMSLAGETLGAAAAATTRATTTTITAATTTEMPNMGIDLRSANAGMSAEMEAGSGSTATTTTTTATSSEALALISDYAGFADIYLNTFYCLAIVCLVSVFDRMDICRWSFSNASELISFRWLIITMIYIATIILTICSDSIDEKLYLFNNNANITLTQQELLSNSVQSVWSSLSVTRSIAAISGWIMIGLTPQEDMLYEHLVDLTKYQLTNN